jgi:hypothetical protein
LIFAPVALTWLAVGKATTAFGVYVGQNAGAIVNFLEFWQNGFGVLGKEWTIGHIALLDFIMISLVILLIAFLHFANEQDRRRIISKESVVDSERMAIALTLNTYLFDKRTTSNVKMNENLATVTQDLLHTTSALGKVGKLIEKSSKEAPTNRQIISELKALNRNKRSNEI